MTDSTNSSTPIDDPLAHKGRSEAASVAWALTGVTLFVLAVGIFIIQQVIDTPQSYAEESFEEPIVEEPKAPAIVVLRPESADASSTKSNKVIPGFR